MHTAPAFRILCPGDARELMALRHRALQECPDYFGTPTATELAKTAGHYRRQLLSYQQSGKALLLGCWQGPRLAGMAGLKLRAWQGKTCGLIYSMYLDPALRGQGHGKTLLMRARQEILNRWQLQRCLMNVEVTNQTALRLYQDCGFEITGKEQHAFWISGIAHDVYVLEAGG